MISFHLRSIPAVTTIFSFLGSRASLFFRPLATAFTKVSSKMFIPNPLTIWACLSDAIYPYIVVAFSFLSIRHATIVHSISWSSGNFNSIPFPPSVFCTWDQQDWYLDQVAFAKLPFAASHRISSTPPFILLPSLWGVNPPLGPYFTIARFTKPSMCPPPPST